MRKVVIFSVFLVLTVTVSSQEAGKKTRVSNIEEDGVISLEGDTKVNDYIQDEDQFDNYYWEDWTSDEDNEQGAFDDSDEGQDSEEESNDRSKDITTTAVTIGSPKVAIVVNATENPVQQPATSSSSNETKTAEFNDPDYYESDPDVAYYDEGPAVVEGEIEITITKEQGALEPLDVPLDWPGEMPRKVDNDIKPEDTKVTPESTEMPSDNGYYGDWDQLVRDWKNWQSNGRMTQTRRLQVLYTGILIGFFALTVAVVLFTFYRGFLVCAAAFRSSANIGGGYKRMDEEAESPVLQQQFFHP